MDPEHISVRIEAAVCSVPHTIATISDSINKFCEPLHRIMEKNKIASGRFRSLAPAMEIREPLREKLCDDNVRTDAIHDFHSRNAPKIRSTVPSTDMQTDIASDRRLHRNQLNDALNCIGNSKQSMAHSAWPSVLGENGVIGTRNRKSWNKLYRNPKEQQQNEERGRRGRRRRRSRSGATIETLHDSIVASSRTKLLTPVIYYVRRETHTA